MPNEKLTKEEVTELINELIKKNGYRKSDFFKLSKWELIEERIQEIVDGVLNKNRGYYDK